MSIMLPDKKTPPKTDPCDLTMLVYGPPKSGKTAFAAQFPGVLFLATESGLNAQNVFQIPISTTKDLREVYCELRDKGIEKGFKTICFDTVDNLYLICAQEVINLENRKAEARGDVVSGQKRYSCIEDIGSMGKGWDLARRELKRVLTEFIQLPLGVILLSHEQLVEIKSPTGKYKRAEPDVPGKAQTLLTGIVDMVLYLNSEGGDPGDPNATRMMHGYPNKFHKGGDRWDTFTRPAKLDYEIFCKAFKLAVKKKTNGGKES